MTSVKKRMFVTAVMICGLISMAAIQAKPVHANDIVPVAVSTYPVNEAATLSASIPGNASVDKFIFTNSTTTASVVTVYKNCTSTTTAAEVLKVAVPSITSASGGTVVLDYSATAVNNPFRYSDICFRKPSDAADSYIFASAHYR